jgi:hypothetical protein
MKTQKTYHFGILPRKHTLVIQARRDIDLLSCEILEYLGEFPRTKRQVRETLQDPVSRFAFLAKYNARYPSRNFKRVVVE